MIVECPGCKSRYDVTGRPPGTSARCRCGRVFELPAPETGAEQLACPQCGANVAATSHRCEYCGANLLVKACPRCFARVFHGASFCGHCGAKVTEPAEAHADGTASARLCPRCGDRLVARLISDVLLDECPSCHGVFVDVAALERILSERRQARADALLGAARPAPAGTLVQQPPGPMYVKCPDCEKMMNRKNFAPGSGIIVDVCKAHGTWFDANELPRVIDFVMKGGLERAEKREAERMMEEARRTRSQQYAAVVAPPGASLGRDVDRVGIFGSILGSVGRILVD